MSVLPAICVASVSAVAIAVVVSYLVLRIALRAIEKSPPDKVPQVIIALSALVGSFRWIRPWDGRDWQSLGKGVDRDMLDGGADEV
jgi:hypothetical protein